MPTFEYTVDDEPQSTANRTLTPVQIMTLAGIDPATNYVVQITGAAQESYKDNPNAEIHMHQHMKFITNFTGEVTVS
jgi:hypothetical protein